MTTIETIELTEKTATNFLTRGQLSVLVPQVKKGDHLAIEVVYEAFKPLIKGLLKHLDAYTTLGEDAENTAWLFFWEAVMRYKDEDFASLPGLLKVQVDNALKRHIDRMKRWHACLSLDDTDADGRHLVEPGTIDPRLDALHYDAALRQGMRKLSPKQREIVLQTVLGDLSLKEYSMQAEISYTAAFTLRKRALRILKKYL
ncbi:MAG: RNA polymerase sigma factor [Phascolarctobacterium sp.]